MLYLIITTSLYDKTNQSRFEERQFTYMDSITNVLQILNNNILIKPIIVENNGLRETYLDQFKQFSNCDVVYTNHNKNNYSHKGVNELQDIKYIINLYGIKDDDIIIKLTGRYKILSMDFFNIILNNTNYDAFIKFFNVCTQKYECYNSALGLFAIKCKYIKSFNYDCITYPEVEFAQYVRKNIQKCKIMEMTDLKLQYMFFHGQQSIII